jgi:hypothetical protein
MEKHLMITAEGKIKMKKECIDSVEDELSKMIEKLKSKVKEIKEKVKKHHAKKETPKEEKNINVEKKEEAKPKKVMKAMTIKQVKEKAKECGLQVTKTINGKVKPKTKKELLDEISKCKEKPMMKEEPKMEEKKEKPMKKEEPKQKKTYDNYSQYNEDEKEFMNAIRDNNGIHRPDKIQKIYKEKFSNKNIEDFYIHRINRAKDESLDDLDKSINDKHSEHRLERQIEQLNEKIKNSTNAFKTKQAQKKADERIAEWNKEKYPKEKELEKYNKIRNIQKDNYEKLKNMNIESVKDADEYANLIRASSYMNLSHKLDAEEKPMMVKKPMMEEEPTMSKIDKIQNELEKLEQLIKMDEKQNEKEHKKLHEEVKQKPQKKVFKNLDEYKDALKKLYKQKALEYHPDKNIGNEDEAKKKFQTLINQYEKKMKQIEEHEKQRKEAVQQKGQRRKRD